jgi:hypothetical protein
MSQQQRLLTLKFVVKHSDRPIYSSRAMVIASAGVAFELPGARHCLRDLWKLVSAILSTMRTKDTVPFENGIVVFGMVRRARQCMHASRDSGMEIWGSSIQSAMGLQNRQLSLVPVIESIWWHMETKSYC